MPTADPFQLEQEERRARKRHAQKLFDSFKEQKLTLKRSVFFVPGWTDEKGECWKPLKKAFKKIFTNSEIATFINFKKETRKCQHFFDFGEVLKAKVREEVNDIQKFDFVGHSMGGLNIRAAITQGTDPLLNCAKCITVATPHWGDHLGGLRYSSGKSFFKKIVELFNPLKKYQVEQGKNLDPDYPPIQKINTLEKRKLFLERIEKLFLLSGTQDFVVKGSAILDHRGIEALYNAKTKQYPVEGTNHIGKIGICQDIRTIILIVHLLLDLPVPESQKNLGNFSGGNYKPGENPETFV